MGGQVRRCLLNPAGSPGNHVRPACLIARLKLREPGAVCSTRTHFLTGAAGQRVPRKRAFHYRVCENALLPKCRARTDGRHHDWSLNLDNSMLAATGRLITNLWFPPTCSGCGERGTWLCPECRCRVPPVAMLPTRCKRCGLPRMLKRCQCDALDCVTQAVSMYPYEGWVERAVRGAKYENERDRAVFLGSLLADSDAAQLLVSADFVVPVPMHVRRRLDRGYNQAERIAAGACETMGLPPPVELLIQPVGRPSQVGLSSTERYHNVEGAFTVDHTWSPRPGARIVIVDDVRTTGSTVSECARALQPLRPDRIDIVTFAAELWRGSAAFRSRGGHAIL